MGQCGLINLASCLPEKFFEYLLGLLNAPLQPLLSLVKDLLSINVHIELFSGLWVIILYVLSMFYALLILWAGLNFTISGHDVKKREKAKTWLRDIIIMIILIQSSYFIYELAIQLSGAMTSTTLSLASDRFFLLTYENIGNMALEITFFISYIATLLLTIIILIIRYAVVAIGVVLFPIGIFFYFFQPLREYGILILHFLGICIFVTFLDAILITGFSQLVQLAFFNNIKILVMISAFLLLDIFTIFLMFFSVIKAGIGISNKVMALATKFI